MQSDQMTSMGPWAHVLRLFGQSKLILALVVVAGCADVQPDASGINVQSTYLAARRSAEVGQYEAALAQYEAILPSVQRGKRAAELRLEYALILLYASRPDQAVVAASQATKFPRSRDIRGRAAILGALADHIKLDQFLAARPPYIAARNRARAVYNKLIETYERHNRLEQVDIIPGRLIALRETLAEIEIAQMRAELRSGTESAASQRSQYIQLEFGDTATVGRAASELARVAQRSPFP